MLENFSNSLGGISLILLALWLYSRYQKSQKINQDMWQASHVMSIISIFMFLWISLLVWSIK